jgi:hypothetical protein
MHLLGRFGQFEPILTNIYGPVTVMSSRFLRYSLMSDIFGLAYLVGQIED